jgi:hypothetical protein
MEIQSENNKKTWEEPELKSLNISSGDFPYPAEVGTLYQSAS